MKLAYTLFIHVRSIYASAWAEKEMKKIIIRAQVHPKAACLCLVNTAVACRTYIIYHLYYYKELILLGELLPCILLYYCSSSTVRLKLAAKISQALLTFMLKSP